MAGEPRWLSDDELAAWRDLQFMHFQLTAALTRDLADSGLSYQDYQVLAALSARPEESARLGDIGHELGWETSRLSHHITRMHGRGLVDKLRCPTDRRGLIVSLTAEGRAAIAEAAPGHVAAVRRLFIDLLTPEQIRSVGEIARVVLGNLPD